MDVVGPVTALELLLLLVAVAAGTIIMAGVVVRPQDLRFMELLHGRHRRSQKRRSGSVLAVAAAKIGDQSLHGRSIGVRIYRGSCAKPRGS